MTCGRDVHAFVSYGKVMQMSSYCISTYHPNVSLALFNVVAVSLHVGERLKYVWEYRHESGFKEGLQKCVHLFNGLSQAA